MRMLPLSVLYAAARARARREAGAIALATLAFMIVLGLVSIVTLWSIAYATGAYNSLYAATQSAAYAAVGQTVPGISGTGQGQLDFNCNSGNTGTAGNPVCGSGHVINIVNAIFSASFPQSGGGPGYGLTWDNNAGGTVQLTDATFAPNSDAVYAYYIEDSSGAAKAAWAADGHNCAPTLNGVPQPLLCWSISEQGAAGGAGAVTAPAPQFVSGVAVYTAAIIPLPVCLASFCAHVTLHVAVAASEAQAQPLS